jgi:hypothetical protein
MFLASHTAWAPWYVVHSDNKRRARLNALTHILSKIPNEELPRSKVKLPKRQERGDYKDPDYPVQSHPRDLLRNAASRVPSGVWPLTRYCNGQPTGGPNSNG